MKKKAMLWSMISILFAGITGLSWGEDDARIIGKIGHNKPEAHLRTASFYLVLHGAKAESLPAISSGDNTRFYSKIWDNLYLQITTESGDRGISGYLFAFSKDEAGLNPMDTNESRDVPSLRELSAADFRSDDNFSVRPLKPGPGTPEDRGALRALHYEGYDVEIRVLEFNIGDAVLKKKPYFKSVSCLVTVTEKTTVEQVK